MPFLPAGDTDGKAYMIILIHYYEIIRVFQVNEDVLGLPNF